MPFQISIIAYAISAPIANLISKSIIDIIPKTNNDLRCPAPITQSIIGFFDAITPKHGTFNPTRKLIPTCFQNIIQHLMLFPKVKKVNGAL